MLIARVLIPAGAETADPDVRAAVSAGGGEQRWVTIDDTGCWSESGFNLFLGPTFEPPIGYHPYGRPGKLISHVAEALGVLPEYLANNNLPPDAVP